MLGLGLGVGLGSGLGLGVGVGLRLELGGVRVVAHVLIPRAVELITHLVSIAAVSIAKASKYSQSKYSQRTVAHLPHDQGAVLGDLHGVITS